MKEKVLKILGAYEAEYKRLSAKYNEAETDYKKAGTDLHEVFNKVRENPGNAEIKEAAKKEEQKICHRYNEAATEKAIYNRARRETQRSAAAAVANIVIEAFKAAPEEWTKTPVHYKRFKKKLAETFGDAVNIYAKHTDGHNNKCGYEIYIDTPFIDYPHRSIYFVWNFTPEEIEKFGFNSVYRPEEIETETRKAYNAFVEYKKRYEAVSKELEDMKAGFNGELYFAFPSVPYMDHKTF